MLMPLISMTANAVSSLCSDCLVQSLPSASEMTYIVSSGALNSTHSLTRSVSGSRLHCWQPSILGC